MKDINLTIRDAGRIKGISATLLAGEPGVGKTHTAELLARYWEDYDPNGPVKQIFFQLYNGVEKEKLLYDYHLPNMVNAMAFKEGSASTHPVLLEGVLYQAARSSLTQKTVLVLDELDKGGEDIDILLLDFLQNGRLSDPMFGEVKVNFKNIIVVITSNEQRELNDALYRRLRYIRLQYPDKDKQLRIIKSMDPASFEELGKHKVELLIDLSMLYRKKEDVERKVVVNQLARLVADLVVLRHNRDHVKESICQWFSPNEQDWTILTNIREFDKFVDAVAK